MRSLVCVLVVAAVSAPAAADAAQVSPNPRRVVAGRATVSGCGAVSGIAIAWTSTDNVVTELRLSSIPAGCVGARLSLTLADATGAALSTVTPFTVSGTSQTLVPSGSPTATSVAAAYVSAVGP
jgi:hypothetical protein